MAAVVVNGGLDWLLDAYIGGILQGIVHVRLFKNDHTPVIGDDIDDYVSADFDDYAEIDLESADWTGKSSVGGGRQVSVSDLTWVCGGSVTPNDIYGYYLLADGGPLIAAERAAGAPLVMDGAGDTITLSIVLNIKNA